MKKLIALMSFVGIAACDQASQQAQAIAPASAAPQEINKVEVEKIIAEYIDKNPQAIMDSVEKYQQQQMIAEQESAKKTVIEKKDKIFSAKQSVVVNAGTGSSYVVEFFDYNCGYCKRATPSVNKLIDERKDLKIVFVEFPVLGPSSELAAKAALAVQFKQPEKYLEFHNKLMAHQGQKDIAVLKQLGAEIGLVDFNFEEEVKNPDVEAAIADNRKLGEELSIHGTPAFIINDELVPGALPYEDIIKIVEETEKEKAASASAPAPEAPAPEVAAPAPQAPAAETAPAPAE